MAKNKPVAEKARKPLLKKVLDNRLSKVLALKKNMPSFSRKTTIAIIVFLFLLGLFYFKRHWLVVATVNGRPIWRWQFNQTLESQYGSQVLDQLINSQLIKQEARKEGIVISQEAVDQEIAQIEESLGSDNSLEEILAFQNLTMKKLREEIESQLTLEALLSSGVEISQEEIDQYLVENEELIVSDDEAERIDEATEAIRMAKINEKFQVWYQDLKDRAKIVSFVTSNNQNF